MQTKRIEIEQKGQKIEVPRRVIKVKRRGGGQPGSGLMGGPGPNTGADGATGG